MPFRPLVLCYHAITDRWEDPLAVRPATFERQLRLLLRTRLRPVGAGALLANPGRALHVTFDDAYRNVAELAVPVLERLGVPATVFACSRLADGGRRIDIPELRHRQGAHPEELDTLSWDALRELAERGLEIGSHTISHAHLTRLSDAELDRELRVSRERIEAEIGRPCRHLAYPFGEHDGRVEAAAARAGYAAAYTLGAERTGAGLHALPRVDIYRADGTWRFLAKVSPVRRPVLAARAALARH